MPIIFQCTCGKTLKVDDQFRGKKAKCPACGNLLTVEEAPVQEMARVEAGAAAERPAPRLPVVVGDDDLELPEIRKPIKRPTAAKRNMLPWLLGGGGIAALLSCLACGGMGVSYYRTRTAEAVIAREKQLERERRDARATEQRRGGQKICQKKLQTLVKAMLRFHDSQHCLPNHAILNPQTGQQLLSWRVTILPYIDEKNLYERIRLTEPWDSLHNRQFWNRMPQLFEHPVKPHEDRTYFQIFQGKESAFPKIPHPPYTDRSIVTLPGITDGPSNTIFIVEAAEPVNWMNPEDISYQWSADGFPLALIGNYWGDDTFLAAFGDADVRRLRRAVPPLTLQAMITRALGEPLDMAEWQADP